MMSHAVSHTCMLMSNCGLSRSEAEAETERYLADLERISAANRAVRAARDAAYTGEEPPF